MKRRNTARFRLDRLRAKTESNLGHSQTRNAVTMSGLADASLPLRAVIA